MYSTWSPRIYFWPLSRPKECGRSLCRPSVLIVLSHWYVIFLAHPLGFIRCVYPGSTAYSAQLKDVSRVPLVHMFSGPIYNTGVKAKVRKNPQYIGHLHTTVSQYMETMYRATIILAYTIHYNASKIRSLGCRELRGRNCWQINHADVITWGLGESLETSSRTQAPL